MAISPGAVVGITEAIRTLFTLWAEAKHAEGVTEEELAKEYTALKAELDMQEWNPYSLPDV
jgi:hypothetical protein